MSKIVFDDGSVIEWIDKETLRYSEGGYALNIWVDFEPGFFSSGRIVQAALIKDWSATPPGVASTISAAKRQDILDKVKKYYDANKRKCRIV